MWWHWQLFHPYHTLTISVCSFINCCRGNRRTSQSQNVCLLTAGSVDKVVRVSFPLKLHVKLSLAQTLWGHGVRCNGRCCPFAKCQQISQVLSLVVTFSQLIRRSSPHPYHASLEQASPWRCGGLNGSFKVPVLLIGCPRQRRSGLQCFLWKCYLSWDTRAHCCSG